MDSSSTLFAAEPERALEQALAWPDRARALRVVDGPSYQAASELLLGIKDLRKEINGTFDPIISKQFEAHREACGQKKRAEAPLLEAERVIKLELVAYDTEQDRLRRIEERRLQEETRQLEEARRIDEAAALEREGLATDNPALLYEAMQLVEQPVTVPLMPVAKATPIVSGIAFRETWSATVTSLQQLITFVAANPSYLNLLQVNQVALNAQARSLKGNLRIPGVQAVATKDVAAGRR